MEYEGRCLSNNIPTRNKLLCKPFLATSKHWKLSMDNFITDT